MDLTQAKTALVIFPKRLQPGLTATDASEPFPLTTHFLEAVVLRRLPCRGGPNSAPKGMWDRDRGLAEWVHLARFISTRRVHPRVIR